ncbi:MAG TPA: helix-turn-helix domain-containing protein [Anaerolineales bacterium]|nr:helix-turn-helix domain-containing protein [Anaerolineales bacterium]
METEIGQALRRARQARSLSLEQVSDALHIKPHYLRALEEGQWEDLPSPAQGRGFLRLYAAFLGVDLKVWQEEPSEGSRLTPEGAPSPSSATEEADGPPAPPALSEEAIPHPAPGEETQADDPAKPIFAFFKSFKAIVCNGYL